MNSSQLLAAFFVLIAISYFWGFNKARLVARQLGGIRKLNSLPNYYGVFAALWCALPAGIVFLIWQLTENFFLRAILITGLPDYFQSMPIEQQKLFVDGICSGAAGLLDLTNPLQASAAEKLQVLQMRSQILKTLTVLALSCGGAALVIGRIHPALRARAKVESVFRYLLLACSLVAIFTTFGILFSVLFESLKFFHSVPIHEFLFGMEWSPQTALRTDQVGSSSLFGALPLLVGTLLIAFIALLIAVPTGLMSAIYLAEYATPLARNIVKPVLEILAGIPTVVYGFFAALTVGPFIQSFGESIGLSASSESALAVGIVLGAMIIPYVSSLADDVISAVPDSLREGALGLGSTQSEMIRKVVIPAALPGVVAGILLAASRAIGETMIVLMAAGLAAQMTANPFESVTTITVQIVTLLIGDHEFNSPKTLAAFALGLLLFLVTLMLNVIALWVAKRFREQYD